MRQEIEELKASDDKIKIIKNGVLFRPYDDYSFINIQFEIDDEAAEELPKINEAGAFLLIKRIHGSVQISDEDPSLTLVANIDSEKSNGWKISTSRITRIQNMIFPHEVEIDMDKKEIVVLFDVYS
jgi:hypothetical protein